MSKAEVDEITAYIDIFYQNNFKEHYQVNELISQNDAWDMFPTIRSLNDHGEYKEIEGIQPKYFEVICNILKLSEFHGRPLDSFKAY